MPYLLRGRPTRRRIIQATSMAALVTALGRGVGSAQQVVTVRMVTHLNGLGDLGYNDLANAGGLRAIDDLGSRSR